MGNTEHKVGETRDLPEDGDRLITEVDGLEVGVFRFDGDFYAIANYCVHQAGPLCSGDLMGCTTIGDDGWEYEYDDDQTNIVCPWHGWRFDVETGTNLDDGRYKVPTYDVEVRDGEIFVRR